MAKFYGAVGYGIRTLIRPGVFEEVITEENYFGDTLVNIRDIQSTETLNDNINAAHIAYLYRIEILIQQKLLNATQDFDRKLNKMVEDEILDAIKISRTQ